MSIRLAFFFLGPFHVQQDGRTVEGFGYDKVRALLAYLLLEPFPHRREALVAKLWPEAESDATGRKSLNQAVYRLRQALPDAPDAPPLLLSTPTTVQVNPDAAYALDLAEFEAHWGAYQQHPHDHPARCAPCMVRLRAATALYRGDLLEGLIVDEVEDAEEAFGDWLQRRRSALRLKTMQACREVARFHEWRGELVEAIEALRHLLALEPEEEEAHRGVMRLLAHLGQQAAARAQYEQCREIFAVGGLPLAPETRTLHERIQTAQARPPLSPPAYPTLFVGRNQELRALTALLSDPACRVITLVGPGGIGKSRLALHVAARASHVFLEGITFIPLAALAPTDSLIPAIAAGLPIVFQGARELLPQLLAYLRDKEILLILDNVEHLRAAVPPLLELLHHAPGLKLLVTSRVSLELHQWEHVVELRGLDVPPLIPDAEMEACSAVQLFVQSAQRRQRDFALDTGNRMTVGRICRLVEGMPLALELAAAWVRRLSCEQIVAELERGLDLLASTAPDLPARHRSVRAALEHSWLLLPVREQALFRRLSVFRGGFAREAAAEVAGADLAGLTILVESSLLRLGREGRYEMHELLRHYGAEQLQRLPDEAAQSYTAHSRYYSEFLRARQETLQRQGQTHALREIATEIENIRAAWRGLVARGEWAELAEGVQGLFLFYDLRGGFEEGAALFTLAIEGLAREGEGNALLRARLQARRGRFHTRLSAFKQARMELEESIAILQVLDATAEVAQALYFLGAMAWQASHTEEARGLLEESLALSQALHDLPGIAATRAILADALRNLGEYARATHACEESRRLFEQLGNLWGIAMTRHTLGILAVEQGRYEEAGRHYQASLALREEIGDQMGRNTLLNSLGVLAQSLGEYEQAEQYYHESLVLSRTLGNLRYVASALNNLGSMALIRQAYNEARLLYEESLSIHRRLGNQRGMAIVSNNLGSLAYQMGAYAEALTFHQEGLARNRTVQHPLGTVYSLIYLGRTALALAALREAEGYYREAITLAHTIRALPRALDGLAGLATLWAAQQKTEQVRKLLALLLIHPATEKETRERARVVWEQQGSPLIAPADRLRGLSSDGWGIVEWALAAGEMATPAST